MRSNVQDVVQEIRGRQSRMEATADTMMMLTAEALVRANKSKDQVNSLKEVEFKVFSQFGDDGIIQYLLSCCGKVPERFVEFGVQDYTESNTRFLLKHDNWSGLVLDSDPENIESIRRDEIYWRHELTAVPAFITRDNINQILIEKAFVGDIGLLSIDIDGNDYWIWECISACRATIVVVEYNALFGPDHLVSIPYQPDFFRTKAHYSNLYWGASLAALYQLGRRKGYCLVGCNSAGNNAFFVLEEFAGSLRSYTPQECFVECKFRESRDIQGNLTFLNSSERLKIISHMPVYDIARNVICTISEL